MNYLDYFIIGFILLYSIWGLSRGLLKISLDFTGYIVAFILAKLFSPALMNFVSDTNIYGNIQNKIFETFTKISPDLTVSVETLKIPDSVSSLINQEPGINKILDNYPKLLEALEKNINKLSGQGFMDVITEYVVMILCVFLIFVFVKIVFSIITSVILSRRDSLPLAFSNRLLGMALGMITSLIILSFAFQFAEAYSLTTSPVLANTIAESKYGHLFTTVPILEWLSKFV